MRLSFGSLPVDMVRAESARFRHPLLLLHGLWTGSWIWREFQAYLAHRGWESWAPSFLEAPAASFATDRVEWLVDACRTLPAPPIIIGHDAGAVIAATLASRVEAPAVVAIAPLLASVDSGAWGGLYAWPRFWAARFLGGPVSPPRHALARTFGAKRAGSWLPDSGALFRALASGALRFPTEAPCPSLLVCAEHDPLVSPIAAERLARRLGWAFQVHGSSHFPMLEPGWESLGDDLHRWLVQTLGERILAWVEDDSDGE